MAHAAFTVEPSDHASASSQVCGARAKREIPRRKAGTLSVSGSTGIEDHGRVSRAHIRRTRRQSSFVAEATAGTHDPDLALEALRSAPCSSSGQAIHRACFVDDDIAGWHRECLRRSLLHLWSRDNQCQIYPATSRLRERRGEGDGPIARVVYVQGRPTSRHVPREPTPRFRSAAGPLPAPLCGLDAVHPSASGPCNDWSPAPCPTPRGTVWEVSAFSAVSVIRE